MKRLFWNVFYQHLRCLGKCTVNSTKNFMSNRHCSEIDWECRFGHQDPKKTKYKIRCKKFYISLM